MTESEVKGEEEGRRLNLATRVMSNGVEVIVAGPTPALRWENSNPQPTLTLSDAVLMLMPQDDPNEFVTKTCTTTFTYLNTITKDGATIVSTDQQVNRQQVDKLVNSLSIEKKSLLISIPTNPKSNRTSYLS